ncbi:unnamed protein product [Pedinophyceae sp. YPF-701]|nr:unnamed protein product [Pedinophyceae sp. YPF-701]
MLAPPSAAPLARASGRNVTGRATRPRAPVRAVGFAHGFGAARAQREAVGTRAALKRRRLDRAVAAAADRDVSLRASTTDDTAAGPVSYTGVARGSPEPLGPSKTTDGVNFAIYSRHATHLKLCLYDDEGNGPVELDMPRDGHRTDDVWHIEVQGLADSGVAYAFRVYGDGGWETVFRWDPKTPVLDPYAPLVWSRAEFGKRDKREAFKEGVGSVFRGTYDFAEEPFDWGADYKRPNVAWRDLIIYEMPVRSFTASATSGLPEGERGTFTGLAKKVDHLKELGITAVELLPVFEYDELEFQREPNPRSHMTNIWGYSHISFMAPMSRFAANGGGAAAARREFKEMVKTLHANGIEVILDVVYNHTAELDDENFYQLSFRGIDCPVYYMMDAEAYTKLLNFSGCGNTVSANHPVVQELILASLRQWVEEYHVDGFRFDLASCLCRDPKGHPLPAPPVIRAIAKDPVLSKVKLIAEPWDIGMYQVGSFPNWDVWAEWNGKYRDDMRKFFRGDPGLKSALATRLAGSTDLFQTNNRKPYHGVNFMVAHDGFSLYDLVAYNGKHNEANGEGGNDGTNDNFSWNCGHEGATGDEGIERLRRRQMKNFMVALMISVGTPMIVMGDEYRMTHHGNNNWYGHDTEWTQFDWDALERARDDGFLRFYQEVIKFRREHHILGRDDFPSHGDITWHEDNWENPDSKFLAMSFHGGGPGDLYAAFNAHSRPCAAHLPPPPQGTRWCRVIDTNLPSPKDYTPGGNKGVEPVYTVEGRSAIVLIAKANDAE